MLGQSGALFEDTNNSAAAVCECHCQNAKNMPLLGIKGTDDSRLKLNGIGIVQTLLAAKERTVKMYVL